MKKISLILSIVVAFSIMQMFSVSAYAAKKKTIKYNIQLESLAESEDAKEFNKYKKTFLKLLNEQTEWAIKAYSDDTFDYFTYEDLDFTDGTKIKGIKHYGLYTERDPYPKYDYIMSCLENEMYSWAVVIEKNDNTYRLGIYKPNVPQKNDTPIGDGWYVSFCSILKTGQNDFFLWYNSPDIITANLKRTLNECGEKGKNIKFVYADIGSRWGGSYGIVFVNDTAKYIYSYGMDYPTTSENFREDTPQAVINLFNELSSELYNNSKAHTEKIDRLYSYRVIMAMYELCDYFEK